MRAPWLDGLSPIPTDGDAIPSRARDVCIIGAGVSGLSIAHALLARGRSVLVIDDGAVGHGMTARTTGHVSSALDDGIANLERRFGQAGAHLAVQSHVAAIDHIERLVQDESIGCDFSRLDGYLFAASRGGVTDGLGEEYRAAQRAGLLVEMKHRAPIADFDTGPAICYGRQAQVHLLRYVAGLARIVRARGACIATPLRAARIQGGATPRVLLADGRGIEAGAIVVATHTMFHEPPALADRMVPTITYAIAAPVPRGSVARALFWDTNEPYHYVRLAESPEGGNHQLLIAGGEDHEAGGSSGGFDAVERWTRERFPMFGEVRYRWSGMILEPRDSLAFIGRSPGEEKVFVVTGDSGHGITHAAIAGRLIADLLDGTPNECSSLYDPSRPR